MKKKINKDNYQAWMYLTKDGKTVTEAGNVAFCEAKYEEGWRLSPSDFYNEEQLDNEQLCMFTERLANQLNMLLNIDYLDDKDGLHELAEQFYGLKPRKNASKKSLKKMIKNELQKEKD